MAIYKPPSQNVAELGELSFVQERGRTVFGSSVLHQALSCLMRAGAIMLILLLTGMAGMAQEVIDFHNVIPDEQHGHEFPVTATGTDGVGVTITFIDPRWMPMEEAGWGIYSARDCADIGFQGSATEGCVSSILTQHHSVVQLEFDEPVNIHGIDLSKLNPFTTGYNYTKEIRFFAGTPSTEFGFSSTFDQGPVNFDDSYIMDVSADQVMTHAEIELSEVTHFWFYAAWKDTEQVEDEGYAVEMNWVIDQIHYTGIAEPPQVHTGAVADLGGTWAQVAA
ncbi:hypothetical protein QA596_09205, partial [Balneolales bacterium ANBcel1]|nr:hypothetical protein [Balneolales bacterium ANBcel1]